MTERSTRYVRDVQGYFEKKRHATNVEVLDYLQKKYPHVSATTVHRITSRLVERGKLALAPMAKGNVMRFDATTTQHDHFVCSNCDMVRDAHVADAIRPILEESIGEGCQISGSLVVTGLCKKCNKEGKYETSHR